MKKKIKDLCQAIASNLQINKLESNNGDYPLYGASGVVKNIDFYKLDKPYISIVKDGAGVGRIAFCKAKSSVVCTMQALVNKDDVDIKYLYYVLKGQKLDTVQNGSTIPHIYFKNYGENEVTYHTFEEQKQIVAELDKYTTAIASEEKQLLLLDELIKSRFIEMFKNCSKEKLGDLCSTHARIGWQKLTRAEFLTRGDYYLVTGWDFDTNNHVVDFNKCYYVTKDRYEQDKKLILKEGDILLTKDGTLGKVAVIKHLDKPATLNGHIFVIRSTTEKLLGGFLLGCFLSDDFKYQMEANKTGSTIVGVTQEALRKFEIPVPPIKSQEEYIRFTEQIDKSKFIVQQQIKDLQELLNKKMDEYFN